MIDMAPKKKTAKDKPGDWGGKRDAAGRPQELKDATTKSVVLDAPSIKLVERYIRKNGCGFSEAVRALILSSDF